MAAGRVPPVAWLLLALPVCFWGGGYTATAIATEHTSGLFLATLAALPLMMLVTRSRLPRGEALAGAALSGLLVVTLFFVGISEGTRLAGAANAAVLISAAPLWVAVLGRLLLGERIRRAALAGLLLGFTGIVLMVSHQLGGDHDSGDLALGISLALLAGIGWAGGTMIVRRLVVRKASFDFVGLTTVQYIAGSPLLIALALGVEGVTAEDETHFGKPQDLAFLPPGLPLIHI
mgnify:CR=1 FL=1